MEQQNNMAVSLLRYKTSTKASILPKASRMRTGILLIAACTVLGISGCSKSKSGSSGTSYSMTANVSGIAFSTDSCSFSVYLMNGYDSAYIIEGNAGTGAGGTVSYPNIYLILNDYHGVGTYNFSTTSTSSYFTGGYNTSSIYYGATSGTATVTSVSSTIVRGTFSFNANAVNGTGTVSITGGTFTAQVQ